MKNKRVACDVYISVHTIADLLDSFYHLDRLIYIYIGLRLWLLHGTASSLCLFFILDGNNIATL